MLAKERNLVLPVIMAIYVVVTSIHHKIIFDHT
jgi:hypothetical protein